MAGRAEFQGPGRLSVHVTVRAGCPAVPAAFPPPACVSSWCCCFVVRACSSLS